MFLIILYLFSNIISASPLSEVDLDRNIFMPRSLSLSGATVSRINLNESIVSNPATSAHSRLTSVEGGYSWQNNEAIEGTISNYYISMLDTNSTFFGGGISYLKRNLGTNSNEHQLNGIINKTLLNNRMSVGFGVNYVTYNHLGTEGSNFNFKTGILYLFHTKTLLGISADNILGDKDKIFTRTLSLSLRQSLWDFFSCTVDFTHRFSRKYNVTGAFELLYKNGFMINLSIRRNQNTGNTYWGFGTGYLGPKISIIYGTMNSTSSPISFMHSIALRIFF